MNDEIDKNMPMTLAEAAELYGFHPFFLAELARKGRLKARKSGRYWLTTPQDVEDYIRSRRTIGHHKKIDLDD